MITSRSPLRAMQEAARRGWPRTFLHSDGDDRARPMQWINGIAAAVDGSWIAMDPARLRESREERVCFCCGGRLGTVEVMGRHRASEPWSDPPIWLSDGPPGHPRCVALAAGFCPHLYRQHGGVEDFLIAWAFTPSTAWPRGYVMIEQRDDPDAEQQGPMNRMIVHPSAFPLTLGRLREYAARDPLGEAMP